MAYYVLAAATSTYYYPLLSFVFFLHFALESLLALPRLTISGACVIFSLAHISFITSVIPPALSSITRYNGLKPGNRLVHPRELFESAPGPKTYHYPRTGPCLDAK